MDGRSYALRWYSVDCVGVALVVAQAVVGAHVLSEALFSCFEFCADGFVDDTDDGRRMNHPTASYTSKPKGFSDSLTFLLFPTNLVFQPI